MKRMYRSLLLAVFIAEALVPAAFAQAEAQEEDGPGRGVARISLFNGDVTVRRGDSGDWMAAVVNAPLLADDRILSGPNSRTEVQLDYYDRIRLGGDTEIRFSELEWRKYQVQVPHGTVIFSALPGTNDQIEFATPAGSLRPLAPGSYRMTVRDNGEVEFTVRRGEAEIFTSQGTRRLTPGRTMRLHLSPDNIPEFQLSYETPRDWLDEFSDQRDHELQRVKSYQYVSRDVPGAEDLDNAGEWVDQPPYGMSWRPYVAPGWAPYREGRWVWADDDYGWTWVSYDPWGWAPYHYGRWFCNGGSWFWYPGAFGGPHFWRPGLVAFFGFGGFGVGVGFGGFGWVPLAPFEAYHPWYGHGGYGGFGHNVNIINNVNIRNTYRNARTGNGVSGMNARDFGQGNAARGRPVSARELGNASVMRGALPISPSRESLRTSDRPVNSSLVARAAGSANARFVSARPAPPSNRAVFGSQNLSTQAAARGAGNGAGFSRAGSPQSDVRSTTQGGWPRTGNGAGAGSGRGSTPASSGSTRGGWGSFGAPAAGRSAPAEAAPLTRSSAGNSSTSQRGGWTSFGSTVRSNPGSGQPSRGGWSTSGSTNSASGYSRGASPAAGSTASPSGWGTGRSTNSASGHSQSASPYRSSPSSSSGWSPRGSSAPAYSAPSRNSAPSRSSAPTYSAPSRNSAPRYSAPSGGSSRQSAPAPSRSSGGGGSRSSAGSPSRGGGGGGHAPRR